jgi:rubredoxin
MAAPWRMQYAWRPPPAPDRANEMGYWTCNICGWQYDPEKGDPDGGIAPGTRFEDIPDDWICPDCGATKDSFEFVED